MRGEESQVIVICTKCGQMAPHDPPNSSNPWGSFHWQQPCLRCGAEVWAAHEVKRDWRTGKLLQPEP